MTSSSHHPDPQQTDRVRAADWLLMALLVVIATMIVRVVRTRPGFEASVALIAVVSFGAVLAAGALWLMGLAALWLAPRMGIPRLMRRVWGQVEDPTWRYALGLGALLSLVLFGLVYRALLERFWSITDVPFAQTFAAILAVGAIVGCSVLTGLLALGILPMLRWLERRRIPAWARTRWVRLVLLVATPLVAGTAVFVQAYARQLELVIVLPWLVLLTTLQATLLPPWLWLRRRWPKLGRALMAGVYLVWGISTGIGLSSTHRSETVREKFARARITRVTLQLLQTATDFDRDGVPWLLGARDCAPFDANIAPMSFDVPANGVDEDCNGADAVMAQREAKPSFYGGAPPDVAVKRYNIVWVIIDAARPDRMSLYGYRHRTTPYLDDIANESLVFDEAFAQATVTMLSTGSMLTGRDPGLLSWGQSQRARIELGEGNVTLAQHLRSQGYRTGIVADRYMRRSMPTNLQGYDTILDSWLSGRRMPWYRRNAAGAVSLGVSFIAGELGSKQPFFLTIYMADPHDPYDDHVEGFPDFGEGVAANYDTEIAFSDRYIGFLIDYLRHNPPLWSDTVLIVSADHGEEFGEHGAQRHGFNCHVETARVPLLMRIPRLKGKHVKGRVGLLDVVPTLLDLTGIGAGQMVLDGRSLLFPAYHPEEVDPERSFFCYAVPGYERIVHTVRSGARGLFHDSKAGTFALYDLVADPGETRDISGLPGEAANLDRLKAELGGAIKGNLRSMLR